MKRRPTRWEPVFLLRPFHEPPSGATATFEAYQAPDQHSVQLLDGGTGNRFGLTATVSADEHVVFVSAQGVFLAYDA